MAEPLGAWRTEGEAVAGVVGVLVAQLISCDLGGDTKRRPLLQNDAAFAPEVGLAVGPGCTRKCRSGQIQASGL